ncbi:uncharacterized protein CLUP02_10196 [Colletotrichum lupini]|uniref:Uncharacterized protein n=1 Tax=Colletotrichum lupini TaxID=145971 RepID=A0A9Q8SX26_9PEZI|nr:uncharacterized protein CLUP02_10196 [Colletotrichum lupini]UQC84700.1 hypothetical protein CLUP02_10196 [Colletotrichum lupini]
MFLLEIGQFFSHLEQMGFFAFPKSLYVKGTFCKASERLVSITNMHTLTILQFHTEWRAVFCPFVIYNQHFSQRKAAHYLTHATSSVPQTGTNSSHPQLVNRREMVAGSTDIRYILQFRVSRAEPQGRRRWFPAAPIGTAGGVAAWSFAGQQQKLRAPTVRNVELQPSALELICRNLHVAPSAALGWEIRKANPEFPNLADVRFLWASHRERKSEQRLGRSSDPKRPIHSAIACLSWTWASMHVVRKQLRAYSRQPLRDLLPLPCEGRFGHGWTVIDRGRRRSWCSCLGREPWPIMKILVNCVVSCWIIILKQDVVVYLAMAEMAMSQSEQFGSGQDLTLMGGLSKFKGQADEPDDVPWLKMGPVRPFKFRTTNAHPSIAPDSPVCLLCLSFHWLEAINLTLLSSSLVNLACGGYPLGQKGCEGNSPGLVSGWFPLRSESHSISPCPPSTYLWHSYKSSYCGTSQKEKVEEGESEKKGPPGAWSGATPTIHAYRAVRLFAHDFQPKYNAAQPRVDNSTSNLLSASLYLLYKARDHLSTTT